MLDLNWAELVPAYGRDYKSAKDAKADFTAGKDFYLPLGGVYTSIRDFRKGNNVLIRYKRLQSVATVKV